MKNFIYLALASSMILVAGCGRNESANSSASCATNAPSQGQRVIYTGPQGSGTDYISDKNYFGHIVNLFKDNSAEVLFDGEVKTVSVNKFAHSDNCAAVPNGTRVKYVGSTGSGTRYTTDTTYYGKVVTGFSNGTFEVQWERNPASPNLVWSSEMVSAM